MFPEALTLALSFYEEQAKAVTGIGLSLPLFFKVFNNVKNIIF